MWSGLFGGGGEPEMASSSATGWEATAEDKTAIGKEEPDPARDRDAAMAALNNGMVNAKLEAAAEHAALVKLRAEMSQLEARHREELASIDADHLVQIDGLHQQVNACIRICVTWGV